MNKFILIFAFAALCFSGCKKDIVPPPDPGLGIESTSASPYSSGAQVSSLDKIADDSAKKATTDSVLIATDLQKTNKGIVE